MAAQCSQAAPATSAGTGTGTGTTTSETTVGSHVFKIDNFSATKDLGVGKSIKSSEFRIGGHGWYIECYPCGIDEDSDGAVSLYLCRQMDQPGSRVLGYCKFTLMESLKDGCFKKLIGHPDIFVCFAEDNRHWLRDSDFMQWEDGAIFIEREDLELLLRDDCFQVNCVVFIEQEDLSTECVAGSHVLMLEDGYSKIKREFAIGEVIDSSKFRVGGHTWCLEFYPCGEEENKDGGRVTVRLSRDDHGDNDDVKVRFVATLLTRGGQIISTIQDFCTFSQRSYEYVCNFLIMMENEALLHDGIQIRCDIAIVDRITATPNLHQGTTCDHQGTQQVKGDVTFEVGSQLFTAHKCVLTTRCTAFMAVFDRAEKENAGVTDRVRVDDIEPRVFKALLHFIYTDALPEINEDDKIMMAQGLLVAADRYAMERLKLICADMLCTYMKDAHTAVDMLEVAVKHGCHRLKEKCQELLKSHLANAP